MQLTRRRDSWGKGGTTKCELFRLVCRLRSAGMCLSGPLGCTLCVCGFWHFRGAVLTSCVCYLKKRKSVDVGSAAICVGRLGRGGNGQGTSRLRQSPRKSVLINKQSTFEMRLLHPAKRSSSRQAPPFHPPPSPQNNIKQVHKTPCPLQ